jgi:hypothetical protein
MPGWRADPTGGFIRLPPPPDVSKQEKVQPLWAQPQPLASPAEAEQIALARKILTQERLFEEMPAPEYLEIQMLRQLRAGGFKTAEALASKYRAVWAFKCEHLKHVKLASLQPDADGCWPSQLELTHGEWFTQHAFACAAAAPSAATRSKSNAVGCTTLTPSTRRRAASPWFASIITIILLESIQYSLDAESVRCGRLLSNYEIFDFRGLSLRNYNITTLRISIRLALSFSNNYPETLAKAAIINLPAWAVYGMNMIVSPHREPHPALARSRVLSLRPCVRARRQTAALPASVRTKIAILGDDYRDTLLLDVDDECAGLLDADRLELIRHRGKANL